MQCLVFRYKNISLFALVAKVLWPITYLPDYQHPTATYAVTVLDYWAYLTVGQQNLLPYLFDPALIRMYMHTVENLLISISLTHVDKPFKCQIVNLLHSSLLSIVQFYWLVILLAMIEILLANMITIEGIK